MAIFRPSGVVGAISGNVGGGCFVNGRGSKVLRKAKAKGASVPREQQLQRATFATVQRSWRTLSVDQQKAWATYANATPTTNRLGERAPLSGYQVFLKNRLFNYEPLTEELKNPPSIVDQPLLAPISVSYVLPTQFIVVVGEGPIAGNLFLTISAMPLQTDSLPAFWGRFQHIISTVAIQNNQANLISPWTSKFPIPLEGQIIAIRFRFSSPNQTWRGEQVDIIKVQPAP